MNPAVTPQRRDRVRVKPDEQPRHRPEPAPVVYRAPKRKMLREPVPGGGSPSRVLARPLHFAHHFGALGDGARERKAVGQDVILPIAARGIAQNAEADVADDADGLHGLRDEQRE